MNKLYISISSQIPEQRARLSSLLLSFVPECGRKLQKYLEAIFHKKTGNLRIVLRRKLSLFPGDGVELICCSFILRVLVGD
jgi:hypothetical protein